MRHFFILIHPYQHIQNLLIFVPLILAGKIHDMEAVLNGCIAFAAFFFSANAMYVFNDYQDIKKDRNHLKKKYGPLESGAVSENEAVFLMAVFLMTGLCLMASASLQALFFLVSYITLNIAYGLYLKHVVVLDVIVVGFGLVLRIFVGASV